MIVELICLLKQRPCFINNLLCGDIILLAFREFAVIIKSVHVTCEYIISIKYLLSFLLQFPLKINPFLSKDLLGPLPLGLQLPDPCNFPFEEHLEILLFVVKLELLQSLRQLLQLLYLQ